MAAGIEQLGAACKLTSAMMRHENSARFVQSLFVRMDAELAQASEQRLCNAHEVAAWKVLIDGGARSAATPAGVRAQLDTKDALVAWQEVCARYRDTLAPIIARFFGNTRHPTGSAASSRGAGPSAPSSASAGGGTGGDGNRHPAVVEAFQRLDAHMLTLARLAEMLAVSAQLSALLPRVTGLILVDGLSGELQVTIDATLALLRRVPLWGSISAATTISNTGGAVEVDTNKTEEKGREAEKEEEEMYRAFHEVLRRQEEGLRRRLHDGAERAATTMDALDLVARYDPVREWSSLAGALVDTLMILFMRYEGELEQLQVRYER